MKKFTAIAGALLMAGLAFSSNAQGLGQAELLAPSTHYQSMIWNMRISWGVDVDMVNPQTDEYGNQYIPVTVNAGGNETTIRFSYVESYDYEKWEPVTLKNQLQADTYQSMIDPETGNYIRGAYSVYLPAGIVTAGDETNEEQTIVIELMETTGYYDYTLTPENFGTYTSDDLKEVTVTFNGSIAQTLPAANITYNENSGIISSDKIRFTSDSIVLDLSDLPNGYYNISIPEGYVIVTGSDGTELINSGVGITYNIWNGLPEATILSPVPNSVNSLYVPVEITWNYLPVVPSASGLTASITCYQAGIFETIPESAFSFMTISESDSNDPATPYAEGGNMLRIDLSSYAGRIPTGANINIEIPVGIVEGAQGPNRGMDIYVYYYAPYEYGAEFDLADGVITITWPESSQVAQAIGAGGFILLGPDDSREELGWYSYWDNPEGVVSIPGYGDEHQYEWVNVDLNSLDFQVGNYTLIVPDCTVLVYNNDYTTYSNPGAEFNFTWTGEDFTTAVRSVNAADDGVYRVYNLQGHSVMTTTDATNINNLPAGLYIINGKKVMIRK